MVKTTSYKKNYSKMNEFQKACSFMPDYLGVNFENKLGQLHSNELSFCTLYQKKKTNNFLLRTKSHSKP